jgi:Family of unknown function (DUF6941)
MEYKIQRRWFQFTTTCQQHNVAVIWALLGQNSQRENLLVMHTEIVTLCHSAIEQSGQLSILAAFNNISVTELPHKFPPFTLACRLRFDPDEAGKHQLTVTVSENESRILGRMKVEFVLYDRVFSPAATMNLVFPISGMELRKTGEHTISLVLDDHQTVNTPFYVTRVL